MKNSEISFDRGTTIDELVEKWPQVIPLFIQYQMACIGCSMAAFDTLEEASRNYQIDPQRFIEALEEKIQLSTSAD